MSPWKFNRFIRAVAQGAVFGYPTDTIWGFGCHPMIESSVDRILQIKQRPAHKGLILLSSEIEFCLPYLDVDTEQLRSIESPGENPTTWLVPASRYCPAWISGAHSTIAIRITDHPLLQRICDGLESPVVSTSANRAGRATVRNTIQMHKQFGEELDFIVTGFATGSNRPSEIKFLSSGETLRASA